MKAIVAFLPQTRDPGREAAARKGGFEREIFPFIGQLMKATEHDPASLERRSLWRKRRNSRGDYVRVDKVRDAEALANQ